MIEDKDFILGDKLEVKEYSKLIVFEDFDLAKMAKIKLVKNIKKEVDKRLKTINEWLEGYEGFEKEIPHKLI